MSEGGQEQRPGLVKEWVLREGVLPRGELLEALQKGQEGRRAFSSTGWGHFLRERPSAAGSSELVDKTFLMQHQYRCPS